MNNLFNLQDQVNALSKKIRCSAKILYNDGALSGPAGCYVFGIDKNTGDIYYKNNAGNWEIIIVGGGGGIFDATVDFSVNTDPNTVGTTFSPNTPQLTDVIYVSTIDASQWTWNGSAYVLYVAPFWDKTGNVGTTPGTNFIGTRDNVAFVVKTNNIERARFLTTGQVKLANYTVNAFTGTAVNTLSVDASGNIIQSATMGTKWDLNGNSNTTPGTNFVGTTDIKDLVFKTNSTEVLRIASPGTGVQLFKVSNAAGVTNGIMTYLAGSGVTAGQVLYVDGNDITGNGSLARFETSTTANLVNGAVRVNGTGAHTGRLVQFVDATTTGITQEIVSSQLTTGTALDIVCNSNSLNSTKGLLSVTNTGSSTNGIHTKLQANSSSQSGITLLANGKTGFGTSSPSELVSVGLSGSTKGVLSLAGNTSGKVIIQPNSTAGSWTLTLPDSGGTSGYVLSTDGSGNTSWIAQGVSQSNFIDNETPSGTMDSVNTTFTLANTPVAGSVHLYLRGLRLKPGTGYTISGTTITMLVIPDSGDELIADYRI